MGSKQQKQTLNNEVRSTQPDRNRIAAATSEADVKSVKAPIVDANQASAAAVGNGPVESSPPTEPRIQIFSPKDLLAFIASGRRTNTDDDVTRRNQALARSLLSRGAYRSLKRLPDDWKQQLDAIWNDYPHCEPFLEYVGAMCSLAASDNGVVEMESPLLNGPPGTGKSTLAEIIHGLIAGGYARASMSAAESGALLGGSQETWANSKPGIVFTTLAEGQFANPCILLDEIDKVSTDSRFDPLGPVYQLLEPALASHFRDLSVPTLPIDASKVLWVATSNDASRIPEPIRQRLVQFDIPLPTPAQSLAIVGSVLRTLRARHPRLQRYTLDDSAQLALIGLAPRRMRKQINLGCGSAAHAGRTVVTAADFPRDASQARRVGF